MCRTRCPATAPRSRGHLRPHHLTRPATLLVAVLLTACSGDAPDAATQPTVTTEAGVTLIEFPAEAADLDAPFRLAESPELRLGVIEGSEAEQFSRIVGGFRTESGEFVIVDELAPPVRRFDARGSVLHVAGVRGQGPGELGRPRRAFPGPDGGVWIWDQADARLIEIDAEGAVSADRRILPEVAPFSVVGLAPAMASPEDDDPWPILAVLSPGQFGDAVASLPEPGVQIGEALIVLSDSVGREGSAAPVTLDTLDVTRGGATELMVETSGGELASVSIMRPWYHSRVHVAPSPEGLWFTNGDRWELAEYGPEGLVRTVRFDRSGEPADAEFRQMMLDDALSGTEDPDQEAGIRSVHADREWPEVVPPIRSLFSDALGRPWLGLGEGLAETLPVQGSSLHSGTLEVNDWLILEADGTGVVGRLRTPARSRPLYADDEGVLLTTVDEFDVPYVEWRPFVGV